MKTLFSSTSFLPQSNTYWKSLRQEVDKIEYAEYGNLLTAFQELKNYDALVIINFFEDIFSSKDTNSLNIILSSLNKSLQLNKPIYFATSFNNNKNLISLSKHKDEDSLTYQIFKESVYEMSVKYSNLYIVDLDKIFSFEGYNKIFDSRNWYFSHMRVSYDGITLIDKSVASIIRRSLFAPKKVLVLDCDNTIWGGVIGEDEISGILLGGDGSGHIFKDIQLAAKNLKKQGVLLTLASKNNEDDVWDVFDNHSEMILTKDDITTAKINWNEKSTNIRIMSEELDLGLDSFVFCDDNPIEREKIKINLPEVQVLDLPTEIYEWPSIINDLESFAKFKVTEEDVKKSEQYKARAKFTQFKQNNLKHDDDDDDFLKKINLRPIISPINDSSIQRASQLTQKTNQFNLRTQRYTETDIKKFIDNKDYDCFICSATDDFGDHGQIGLCILKLDRNKKRAFLDTLLLSCRILGRGIEFWLLQSIINHLKNKKICELEIQIIHSKRNHLVKEFIDKCKLSFDESDSNKNLSDTIKIKTDLQIVDVKNMY